MADSEVDEVTTKVIGLLGAADINVLTEVCGEINLAIPPSAEGSARKLFRVLNRYLNSADVAESADEGLGVMKAIEAVLDAKQQPPPATTTTVHH